MTTEPRPGASLTRRRLVKAGVTSAWAVPAITIVTSAPAMAAASGAKLPGLVITRSDSGGSTTITRTSGGGLAGNNTLSFTMTVLNQATAAATGVTLRALVTASDVGMFQNSTTTVSAGWTASELSMGSSGGGLGASTYTAVYSLDTSLAGSTPMICTPTIVLGPLPGAGTIALDAYADGYEASNAVTLTFT